MTHFKQFVIVAIAFSLAFSIAPTENDNVISAPITSVSGAGGVLG
jgi:hypothetical protein